jgi:hypothetical protein
MKIVNLFLKKFIFTPLLEKTQEMPKVFHRQKTNMEAKLVYFVKWSILELACNANLDIRKYNDATKPSALIEGLEENDNNLDTTIETIVKALLQDTVFQQLLDNMENEPFEDIFNFFIDAIGLYQIENLHPDYRDVFQQKLEFLIK